MGVVTQFLQEYWGDLASVLGVVVSIVGLVWAVRVARGARSAARAAKKATQETTDRIGRTLVVVDLERAVALIQLLKLLHRVGRWDAALEQYQLLRRMLTSILSRHTDLEADRRTRLAEARNQVSIMEQSVERKTALNGALGQRGSFSRQLNKIQTELEEMASTLGLRSEGGGI
jgi:hypothetical protein